MASVVVLILLALTATLFVREFERRLIDDVDDSLIANADVVRRSIAQASPELARRIVSSLDFVVQIVNRRGGVTDGTVVGSDLPALIDVSTISAGVERSFQSVDRLDVGSVRAMAEPIGDRGQWMIVARSTEQIDEASASLVRLGMLALPLVAAALALMIWWVVGRGLRPVDDVRRAASSITESDLANRLPVPHTDDGLARLVVTMNGMLDRVETAVLRERRFVADASHELRSPLAGARALLETAGDDVIDAEMRSDTLATIARLETLVEQLLDLAGSGSEHSDPQRPVDLDELVLAQAARLRRTTELSIDTGSVSGGQVRGRENELGRLIENLTTNAVRHAQSSIRLSVTDRDGWVELTVADDGAGVPVGERKRIFLRFARLDDSRAIDAGGAGLGLAIVDAIVRDHGGTISVDDADLGGAKFVVRLPSTDTG